MKAVRRKVCEAVYKWQANIYATWWYKPGEYMLAFFFIPVFRLFWNITAFQKRRRSHGPCKWICKALFTFHLSSIHKIKYTHSKRTDETLRVRCENQKMRMREKNVFPSGNLHLCNEQRVELTSRAQNALTRNSYQFNVSKPKPACLLQASQLSATQWHFL